ncbi:histidinol phosphate aminotransferase [Tropicibacter oceani]|uniref:Histidinol phosphate aminotransferase n=1 Tax=Tropicibacter oceani TaxID=3058420 RepID=A0ABY8QGR4_9RHOB|nr:histidinol phosphate aminotransferase [Tropicibacter oceani]WGW03714.1 histidinol phosphate aminotransferase [Tropicibacter oceani]
MNGNHPEPVEDYTTANLILIFVNLMWIFAAVWSAWGLGPVLVLATVLNHLITRLDLHKRRKRPGLDGTGPI